MAQIAHRLTLKGVSCRSTHHAIRKKSSSQVRIRLAAHNTVPISSRCPPQSSQPFCYQAAFRFFLQQTSPSLSALDWHSYAAPTGTPEAAPATVPAGNSLLCTMISTAHCTTRQRTINIIICWSTVVVHHMQPYSIPHTTDQANTEYMINLRISMHANTHTHTHTHTHKQQNS